ncbi:Translin [Pyrolobus fumarii 1A]|uniref:Translin n=1 Tax=Pyrolobus fumarii (strain DSM 11204 / 1A) TaxID=694429 RepID=G0EEG2_PYRF1|nr:haloacid dehalogenase [Pyrolobus fumarii]AEM38003.1 Translin [Pyrolobus fumarii 1A]
MLNILESQEASRILRRIIERIDGVLSRREELRDNMIRKSREVIRYSGWAINAVLRGRLDEAREHLKQLDEAFREFLHYAKQDERLFHSGLVDSTLAEYVEAKLLYSLVIEARLPTPEELGVPEIPYLQGLGDVIGELRRLALDRMRIDDTETAAKLLELMEALYNEMRSLEYPDALMPGVRHKVDVARRLIDDTKALLIEVKGRRTILRLLEKGIGGGDGGEKGSS